MAGQAGRDMLIKVGDGGSPESFATVAGIRTKTFTLSSVAADATTADSEGGWRELLAGSAVKRVEAAGSGVFKDAASDAHLRAAFFAGAALNMQLVVPDFGVLGGAFVIAELSYGGEHDGEATFAVKLQSAGPVVFAAA